MGKAHLALAPDPFAPSKARQLLAEALQDQSGLESLARAQLALSEIVTNAIRHGGTSGEQVPIQLFIERTEDRVTVRVIQPGPIPERPSIVSVPEGWSTHGYGLGIIDAVADRWGIHLEPPSVWFELRL
jgi:anti-sigma regulatory factor (Ser/Thr protein kinase)